MRVVVTGASAGIGRAAAIEFAKRGARVALLARGQAGLEGAKQDVERAGGTALVLPTDVADAEAVERAAAEVERAWGGIDIWVNDAMATVFSPFETMSVEDFRRVTEVTYFGAVWGTRAALKRMLPREHGTIVQVGSALAYRSIPLQSAYCGARTTLPGNPRPVGKVFQPEVAARAIVDAALYPSRERYVGWPAVEAVLGNMFIPGILDRYLARKAWNGQFDGTPLKPGRPDNLYQPVEADFGAHGRFDDEAHRWSWQYALAQRAGILAFGLGLAALGFWRLRRR